MEQQQGFKTYLRSDWRKLTDELKLPPSDLMWPTIDQDGLYHGIVRDWVQNHSKKWFTHVKKFDLCIQAGGACGLYPYFLMHKFKLLYTFEPHPLSFHCLVNNCQSPNVIKIQAALGDKHGFIGNQTPPEGKVNIGANGITQQGTIPQLKIDDFDWPTVDLIALDVELYEHNVLKGGAETIKKFKPVIVGENTQRNQVADYLKELDYKMVENSSADTIWVSNSQWLHK